MATNQVLSDDDKRTFMRQGYIVLRGAVPLHMVDEVLRITDEAFENGEYEMKGSNAKRHGLPQFRECVMRHESVRSVFAKTDIYPATMDLLGSGNVNPPRRAQIAYRGPEKLDTSLNETMAKDHYHIDCGRGSEKYWHNASPFSLLVGVCLSPGQEVDENRGQLTVWPGSHVLLHQILRDRIANGLVEDGKPFNGHGQITPDIGEPIRVLLHPGDAVLAHQRLGHSSGLNGHTSMRKNLYYRVSHKRHDALLDDLINGSVYTEYEGLSNC